MADLTFIGLDAMMRSLSRYTEPQFSRRIQAGLMKGTRKLVRPMRIELEAQRVGHGKNPGLLKKSVKARRGRQRPSALVGPTAPHRHLVTGGHRIVTGGGVDTGRRARANPFVDRVAKRGATEIVQAVVMEELNRR